MSIPVIENLEGLISFHEAWPSPGLRPMDIALIRAVLIEHLRLQAEVAEWKERYEAERADHEASLKEAEEVERNLGGGQW